MLQPTNRLTLIDAMRPPAGFGLESAMAVTFTLNLSALLAAPAAFAIAGLRDAEAEAGGQTPVELIHALRAHAHKLTVFSEAGEIGLPPASRAFAFLEGAVVPVSAPRGGIVHPKVWVLRYETSGETRGGDPERRLRVLIASRNLTFDESWDTVMRLDETPGSGGAALDRVGDLFTGLLGAAIGEVRPEHVDRVGSLARALRTARFELPAGVDGLGIHVFGLDRNIPSPFPDTSERSMIISPFLADHYFTGMHPGKVDKLVSRQESLDGLGATTLERITDKYVFDDGSTFEKGDPAESRDGETPRGGGSTARSSGDPGRPLVGLHAKVFAFETGDRAHLFVGSANATGAAFGGNVEILAELRGAVADLGIDRLCDGDGEAPGLSDLFSVYRPGPEPEAQDQPGDSILDRTRREIARVRMEGAVEAAGEEGEEWAVTYRSIEALPDADGVEIHCWPLTTPGNRRPVRAGAPMEVRFETSLEAMSGFLAFELKLTADRALDTRFAVPVPLTGVPEHRAGSVLKALIGNAERFLRYLLALLYEDSDQIDLRELTRVVDGSASGGNGTISFAVLERLLRTMKSDPMRLAGLHPLIADLRADDALPPGFAELWDAMRDVMAEGVRRQDVASP